MTGGWDYSMIERCPSLHILFSAERPKRWRNSPHSFQAPRIGSLTLKKAGENELFEGIPDDLLIELVI